MTYNIVLNNMSYLINKIKRAYARRKHQKPVTPVTGWYKLLIYLIISCDRQRHFARHSPSQPVTDTGKFILLCFIWQLNITVCRHIIFKFHQNFT